MDKTSKYNYQVTSSSQIYLNSNNADIYLNSTYKSNVVFFFPNTLLIQENTISRHVSLVNAQIPASMYQINYSNNQIKFNATNYTIPVGNYTVYTLMSELTTLLGSSWTFNFNSLNNTMTMNNTSSFTVTDSANSLFPIIGLIPGITYSSTANSLICPFSVNFTGLNRVNIKSTSFYLKAVSMDSTNESRILATVPLNTAQNGVAFYENKNDYKTQFSNSEISSIAIEITDDSSNYINFNNVDWTLTLQIDIVNEIVQTYDDLYDIYNKENNLLSTHTL